MRVTTNSKLYSVYRHVFPNGKSYIGITCVSPISRRWRAGSSYKAQRKIWNAIQKYSWENVIHEVLFENLTLEEANRMEQESILRYDSVKNGYNISLGGDGVLGVLCSDATKEKIGHANKGKRLSPIPKEALRNWKKEHGSWNRGKSLSGEHLRKITEERQARCNKRILAIDPITNIVVGEFKSCTKAANHFGVTKNTISRCAHGGRPTSCGFVWRYV